MLEPEAAKLAAERANEQEIEELGASLEALRAVVAAGVWPSSCPEG